MKIVDNNKKECTIFEELKRGDVFRYDKGYYMKIWDILCMMYASDENEDDVYNAINLVNGEPISFAGYITIEPLNAELIIK